MIKNFSCSCKINKDDRKQLSFYKEDTTINIQGCSKCISSLASVLNSNK